MPQKGDGELILRELTSDREHHVPIGALPPAPIGPSEENPERPEPRRAPTIAFTKDASYAIATLFPNLADTIAAKRAKKPNDDMPPEGLVITKLASGDTTRISGVKNFQVASKGSNWLAYLKTPIGEKKKTDENEEKPKGKKKEKKYGSELILRNLDTGNDRSFANVLEYSLTRDGAFLIFAVSSKTETENGVFIVRPKTDAAPFALATGPGRYLNLKWDRQQNQLAFLTDRAEPDAASPRFAAFLWTRPLEAANSVSAASEIVSATTTGVPAGSSPTADSTLDFTFDGKKIAVSTAPTPPVADERLDNQIDDEKVKADLWHWNDDAIPTIQKIRAPREQKRTFIGVLDLTSRRFTQLADESLATVHLSDDGSRAFGSDNRPYRKRLDYEGAFDDVYLVDPVTSSRQIALRQLGDGAGLRWSPNNRYLAYYHDQQWFALDASNGQRISLTSALGFAFHNEDHDRPQEAPAYGSAGWTSDGESFIAYDRFDVWQLFPDGRPAKNLTASHGRAETIVLRVEDIRSRDPENDTRGIDPAQPLMLRGESEITRATGFFRTNFQATSVPIRLLWGDKDFFYVTRAKDADTLVLMASRFDEYPDLHTTNAAFATPKKISAGGRQLQPFQWGTSELMTFRNADGVPLSAALFKPANFDPAKKYPVIVYLYERLSHTIHFFSHPAPSNNINPSYYTSNGYIVMMPDVIYDIGHPGKSALKCILPAVDTLVARGFVEESAIGIQGHSWGGYQIAYMLTQTTRFRAAEAGAIVCNMTSAYSGIRWGSGRARQAQYEKSQSRLGRPLHEAPHLYLENSPLFAVERVTTPLLLLHNDHDDAVPWQQGIEFFLALRRLEKEAYLFNYNGALHGLRRRADLEDYAKRMRKPPKGFVNLGQMFCKYRHAPSECILQRPCIAFARRINPPLFGFVLPADGSVASRRSLALLRTTGRSLPMLELRSLGWWRAGTAG